ncbi:MAG: cation transporter [Butyrivibrio sp.]|nr:cation transporter [Butyrivibrio sp.]
MITILARFFIKNYKETGRQEVRLQYGTLSGMVGICFNIILFTIKLIAGILSGSIAIMADAFNNLSDAGSSVVTIIGFRVAGQKPDEEHPFGHGRIEYIAGLVVAMFIIIMAVELMQSSVNKIMHPAATEFSFLIAAILILSIFVKLYMFYYNLLLARQLDSEVIRATAIDSISDVVATTVVLLTSVFSARTGILIDGYCGIAVGIFILKEGFDAFKSTVSPLLGEPPTKDFVAEIEETVMQYDGILGVHDLIVHNYGPMNIMMSLHAEVSAEGTLLEAHDLIDSIEHDLNERYQCNCVIHMDPVSTEDPDTNQMKEYVRTALEQLDVNLHFHDFRIIHTKLKKKAAFDVMVPFHYSKSDEEIMQYLKEKIREYSCELGCEITIDKTSEEKNSRHDGFR